MLDLRNEPSSYAVRGMEIEREYQENFGTRRNLRCRDDGFRNMMQARSQQKAARKEEALPIYKELDYYR